MLLLYQKFVPAIFSLPFLFSDVQQNADLIAKKVLQEQPLIDLHVDLPVVFRYRYRNDISNVDYNSTLLGNVDLPRLQEGMSGGMFSIAYVPCPSNSPSGGESEKEMNELFLLPSNMVRDTLEQIDVTNQLVNQYKDQIALTLSSKNILSTFQKHKKINHLIGIEGAHSIGNSLAVLRTMYEAGARYLTLTHTCHNAFADSAGSTDNVPAKPLHGGLSEYGKRLIKEMNRLGMIIDVSHTSDDTAKQAILLSKAPVIFSHSGARSINDHIRNVPDDLIQLIAEGSGRDGVIGIPALPSFIALEVERQTVQTVADHVEHIAKIAGKSRVAIGSDFNGFLEKPINGLEDVRMYKNLLSELNKRGWSQSDLKGLVSGNFIRVFGQIEKVAQQHRKEGTKADTTPWKARPDFDIPEE